MTWKTYVKKPLKIKEIQKEAEFVVQTLEGEMKGKRQNKNPGRPRLFLLH